MHQSLPSFNSSFWGSLSLRKLISFFSPPFIGSPFLPQTFLHFKGLSPLRMDGTPSLTKLLRLDYSHVFPTGLRALGRAAALLLYTFAFSPHPLYTFPVWLRVSKVPGCDFLVVYRVFPPLYNPSVLIELLIFSVPTFPLSFRDFSPCPSFLTHPFPLFH